MSHRRVVITGTGLISALGTGTEKNWQALLAGTSGISLVTRFDPKKIDTRIAGEVKDFEPEKFIDRREVRRMDLYAQYAMAAAAMAVEESGLPVGPDVPHGYTPERVGVIVGSGIGGISSLEEQHRKGLEKGFDRLSPFFIIQMIVNMAPGLISMRYNCKGPNWAPVSACATSAHAIGEAWKSIKLGETDAAIAGGAEAAITPLGLGGFSVMKALSTRNDDPAAASRPFDKDRDGFVMGEGAGMLILEELEAAKKRGARILAELVGYGANSDAYHVTQPAPEGEGAARCMRLALQSAGMNPEQVGYINAHGTSTPFNDANETKAIKAVFGDHARKVAVSSTKSMTGHMLGAAGGYEGVVSALALSRNILPPTINQTSPDPECDLDYVPNAAREAKVDAVMSNSFGFGGTNAVLLFKRF
ncbi:beta-ketoacyl-ACP synthase II [Myxococcus sp. CA051A]|uniref:3-oxoacyl-[acyl-carrier-protein] synthase 2 n=1 Tax=Myxococcus llanfairpwllgwyngyllgogerychwyrndrobwllllantysiliogogogochensis TaxID=2590453 RepID=A0A540WY77_9BACT|nr:beta-ketoacyl-ACP synthase II [Myxococcus llanfairpwllgwyngyllgogerychwyrndrobwllllantysiliogogogochensis]NTX41208.1 beta-ketoacyl-ACP synthase II [Myxococcus sp. CA033]NTX56532.1 beta-ketoacyl-ACP synthase II [Myxococcus sp. CA039A]NTX66976.1 beta-ketoacyl-ACP synthase II [Myxococcus sp. CA051A]TQF13943.1 beta-ketoacyl-ACP synthase II [Myxococcus llanfairpwllgwyngyllgogerychwyrndrobwllllantysiliogogogochensis]